MNIGVDLDGVLFDTENYFRVDSLIYDIEHGGEGEINREECHYQNRFNWSKEQENKFLENNYEKIEESAPVMYGAKYVIKKLKQMGHKLYVITNRGNYFEGEIAITLKRLKEEDIEFDGLFFYAKEKGEVCKNNNIDVLIDDLYDNVKKVTEQGIKCLYYRDLVLKFFNSSLCHEVRNWADIYYEIVNFDKWK